MGKEGKGNRQTAELKIILGVHTQLAKAVYQICIFISSHFIRTTAARQDLYNSIWKGVAELNQL